MGWQKKTPKKQNFLSIDTSENLAKGWLLTCARLTHIGMTTTTLSIRLTVYRSSGAIQAHMKSRHHTTVTREELEDNTKILRAKTDFIRLRILEALYVQEKCPTLNQQATGNQRTLKSHSFPHTQNRSRQLQLPTSHTPNPHSPDAPPP